jgi:hypothetical protein
LVKWSRYTVLLISLLMIVAGKLPIVRSCAGGGYEEELFGGITFIQSDLSRDALFKQYYYDVNEYRSEWMLDEAIRNTRSAQNLKEWEGFFGKTFSRQELKQLVYTMTAAELDQLLKKPVASGDKRLRPANQPALQYLLYAKQCEPYVVALDTDWEDGYATMRKRRKPEAMRQLINRGLAGYAKVNSAFLKARYAYQVIRLANYAGFDQKCVSYYKQLIPPLGKPSIVADWALRLKAGALRKVGREAEALVHTSLLFDQNRYMMDEAYLDFYIPPEHIWEQCLKIAGQKHRQATLWLLRGLREKRFMIGILEQMYQLEPKSSRLEMLLVRYINRLEQEYFGTYLFSKSLDKEIAEKETTTLKYCNELQRFLSGVDRGKVHDPALWDTLAAYLSIVEQKYGAATDFLKKAATYPTKNKTLKNQIEILKGLKAIVQNQTMTPGVESACVKAMTGLETANKNQNSNCREIRTHFYSLMAQKYLAVGNATKGYFCLAKAGNQDGVLLNQYFSGSELDLLLGLLAKRGKSPFEKALTVGLPVTRDDLYSVKGTFWLRQENFKAALACFNNISTSYWKKRKQNKEGWYNSDLIPTSFEQSCYNSRTGLYRYPKQGFTSYTKLEFTRKVVQLEASAAQNPAKAAQCYYQIANAFFHSPSWAYNDNLGGSVFYERSPFGLVDFAQKVELRSEKYLSLVDVRKTALKYYLKAMKATKSKEFGARCCFLAQACTTGFSDYESFCEPGKDQFYYLQLLRQQYGDTQYFKNCLKECDTLKQYLNK